MASGDKPPSGAGQAFGSGVPGMTYRQWLVGQILQGYHSLGGDSAQRDRHVFRAVAMADRAIAYLSATVKQLGEEKESMNEQ